MKRWVLAPALFMWVLGAVAQERVPDEEAKEVARVVTGAAAKVKAPLKMEVDLEKPYAKRKDEYGVLLLPAQRLSAETISKAGKDIVPVGQV